MGAGRVEEGSQRRLEMGRKAGNQMCCHLKTRALGTELGNEDFHKISVCL